MCGFAHFSILEIGARSLHVFNKNRAILATLLVVLFSL